MTNRLTVQLVDWRGNPVGADMKVKLIVEGWLSGGDLEPAYTDDTAHAHFETAGDYAVGTQQHLDAATRTQKKAG